jgi:hypothetical protein
VRVSPWDKLYLPSLLCSRLIALYGWYSNRSDYSSPLTFVGEESILTGRISTNTKSRPVAFAPRSSENVRVRRHTPQSLPPPLLHGAASARTGIESATEIMTYSGLEAARSQLISTLSSVAAAGNEIYLP